MARKQYGMSKGREVGRKQERKYKEMTDIQQIWLSAALIFCNLRGCAMFVGTPTSTGSIRLNLYPGDEPCRASLNFAEDWRQELLAILSDTFEEEITEDDVIRAVPWIARKAAEAPADRNPTRRSSPAVEVPERPS